MRDIKGFRFFEILHTSKYTITYRGLRLHDEQPVILKIPCQDYPTSKEVALLQNEFQLLKHLKQLSLSGVIRVLDFTQVDFNPVLILDNCEGKPLDKFLSGKALDLDLFFDIALQLIEIIEQLHKHHIIHKDIQPANILIQPETNRITLIDLSTASQLSEEIPEYVGGQIVEGSIKYISPEQTGRMNCPIDYRTDFYSLGMIFFEMLTGQLPFKANDSLEWVYCHIAKTPPPITSFNQQIPPMLSAIIAKLLAKMPEDRYASSLGIKTDLLLSQKNWQAGNESAHFNLGEFDVYDHLHISAKLYSREVEVTKLLTTFNHIMQGSKALLLVSGSAGVGKSALIKEVHKPIVNQHGYFINGKFDQLQQSTPYSAIIAAFKILIQQILTEPENEFKNIQHSLLSLLGNIGQVIIEMIPEMELILGKQPPIPTLPPTEAQNRFNSALQRVIQGLATSHHPLVIFLDDLQWADAASLKLIEMLLISHDIKYLLIIGTYRSNEVNSMHPLKKMIQNVQENLTIIDAIQLKPLQLAATQQLIIDTFNSSISKVQELSTCIQKKTGGNPFFINQFLKTLNESKTIWFSYENGEWQWDISKIKQQAMTENVIDLLTEKIHTLSSETQNTLKLASCIGHQFNLKTLITISERTFRQVASALWEAIQANLVVPIEESFQTYSLIEVNESIANLILSDLNYRFIHDRVQQAAYELIPNQTRKNLHLKIGRLLLRKNPELGEDSQLFIIMDQFNHCLDLITDSKEKHLIAYYNWLAGKKLLSAMAYQVAMTYLQNGLYLMSPINWQTDYSLTFSLYKDLSIAKHLAGQFDEAQEIFNLLITHAKSNIDKVAIYRLNIEMLSVLNKHHQAMNLGVIALNLLGIKLPKKVRSFHIFLIMYKIKMQLLGKDIENIKLTPMASQTHQAAVDLIGQLYNSAFISNQHLYIYLVCTNISLCLKYGYTNSTLVACLTFSVVLIHVFNNYKEGMAFFGLYKNLKKTYGDPDFGGKNNLIIGGFIDTWRYHAKESLNTLRLGANLSWESGYISYCNYSNIMLVLTILKIGEPLSEVKKELKTTYEFIKLTKIKDFRNLAEFLLNEIESLEKVGYFSIKRVVEFENQILATKNYVEVNIFYSQSAKMSYILDHFSLTDDMANKQKRYIDYGLGLFSNPECDIYQGLALCAMYPNNKKKQKNFIKMLTQIHKRLTRWANWSADNYQHYLLILQAELARIHHKKAAAFRLYEKAINAAKNNHDLTFVAISNECASRFYAKLALDRLASFYLLEAYLAYQRLGMMAKCKLIEKNHPNWKLVIAPLALPTEALDITSQTLDMATMMKFTQTLSREIEIDKLLKQLIKIILENAGATRCILLTKKDDYFTVEIEGTFSEQQVHFKNFNPVSLQDRIPLTLIQYIQRVPEPILIDDAMTSQQTMHDPYIIKHKIKSLLLLPIFYQGKFRHILYLEHQQSKNVFSEKHLQALQLLTAQASISLENARLYYQATHDLLTGLCNRNLLQTKFLQNVDIANDNNHMIAILFVDIDYFKLINDTLGHEIGDQILIYIATQFAKCLKEDDISARLGGDEFVVMLNGITDLEQINKTVNSLFECFNHSVKIHDHTIHLSISMGISLFPEDGKDLNTLINRADIALYKAKTSGRNCFQYYTPQLRKEIQDTHTDEIALQHAIDRNELCLYYQPIYQAHSKRIISLEALIRWRHPLKGMLEAGNIIPLAEQSGMIISIGEWALHAACQQIKLWQQKGLNPPPVAVNLSALQTKYTSIFHLVTTILNKTKLDPRCLELELTETSFIENSAGILEELRKLNAKGIHLTLDDFGTGYSALGYIKRIPLSTIKIDQSFIHDLSMDKEDRAIVLAIIALAHHLNMRVIAEGVETAEQYQFLLNHNVDAIQGHYFMPPLDSEKCEALLTEEVIIA